MSHTLIVILLTAGAVFCSTQAYSAQEYVLVENGAAKCAIVLPEECSQPMDYGAQDIAHHLNAMSGADVPVIRQKDANDLPSGFDGYIIVTDKPLPDETPTGAEEYCIRTISAKPWKIRIYGDNRRGALYGCYGLLQDVLGCRWFTREISDIPKKKTVAVGELNIRQKPSFELRDPYYYEALTETSWAVRNRINGSHCKLDESVGGRISYGTMIAHTFFNLVPPEKYFAEHPEYFSLVNGKRVNDRQLCLTNPDTLRICIESIRERIARSPRANIFSVSQEDNEGGACQCEMCRKVLEEEGAESGPILRFVNAVAREIAKDHPDVLIETLAYNYSQKPPKLERPLPNVRVRLCIPWTCKAHSLEDECSRDSYRDLHDWSKITGQLYIWDYNTEYNDYMLLHPSLRYTKTVFDVFHRTGVVGVFMLGSYQGNGGALSEMKSYLCSRLMWDHTQNPDVILDEYIKGVYGAAAPLIMQWITLIHSPFKVNTGQKMLGIYDTPQAAFLTKEILDKSDALIEEAEQLCADDPVSLNEIGKVRMWIDYTRIAQIKLRLAVRGASLSYGVSDRDLDRIDRWLRAVERYDAAQISEARKLDLPDLLTRESAALECVTLENAKLRLDVVPSLGGKIVRMSRKPGIKNILVAPKSVFKKRWGGIEEYVSAQSQMSEFLETKYSTSRQGNALLLRGTSPEGRQITREYVLQEDGFALRTSVKNVSDKPLEVQIWGVPMLAISGFDEIKVDFENAGGGKTSLRAKDFSINWAELSKKYTGADIPAGRLSVGIENAEIDIEFEQEKVQMLEVFNSGGLPHELVSPRLHCKPAILNPGEQTSFEQTWRIR